MSTILKNIELNTVPIPLVPPTLREFRQRLKKWTMCGEEKSGMPPTTVIYLEKGDTLVAQHVFARQVPSVRLVHRELNYMFETYVCYGGPTTTLLRTFQKPDREAFNQAHLQTLITGQPLSSNPSSLPEEPTYNAFVVRCPWED